LLFPPVFFCFFLGGLRPKTWDPFLPSTRGGVGWGSTTRWVFVEEGQTNPPRPTWFFSPPQHPQTGVRVGGLLRRGFFPPPPVFFFFFFFPTVGVAKKTRGTPLFFTGKSDGRWWQTPTTPPGGADVGVPQGVWGGGFVGPFFNPKTVCFGWKHGGWCLLPSKGGFLPPGNFGLGRTQKGDNFFFFFRAQGFSRWGKKNPPWGSPRWLPPWVAPCCGVVEGWWEPTIQFFCL